MRSAALLWLSLVLLGACHRPYGAFVYRTLDSAAEHRALHYGVHTPPGWDGRRPLPIVLLLHGAGDDHTSADRKSVVHELDAAIMRGALPPVLVVTPEGGRGFWANWADGTHHLRDFVLDEVLRDVRARYPTVAGREGLHLVGVSMGGGGGLQMFLREPGLFASATIVSAPILDESGTRAFLRRFTNDALIDRVFGPRGRSVGLDPFAVLVAPEALAGARLWFGAAADDYTGILASNERFAAHLRAHGVPHHFEVFPGKHRWRSWAHVFPVALSRQLAAGSPL